MPEDMTIDLKNKLENFVTSFLTQHSSKEQPQDLSSEFEKNFESLSNGIVKTSINEVNNIIKPIGSLEISDNIGFNGNYIIHVSLHADKSINVLEAPYLVFEGYPKMGKVRVFDNFTHDKGAEYRIEDIDKEVIQNVVTSFLEKTTNVHSTVV